jgi:hypothetical protein
VCGVGGDTIQPVTDLCSHMASGDIVGMTLCAMMTPCSGTIWVDHKGLWHYNDYIMAILVISLLLLPFCTTV